MSDQDQEKIEKAHWEFDRCTRELQKQKTMAEGGAKAEQQYARAYQVLVKLGVRPQIKKKYRRF